MRNRNRELTDIVLCIAKRFAASSLSMPVPFLDAAALPVDGDLRRRLEKELSEVIRRNNNATTRRSR